VHEVFASSVKASLSASLGLQEDLDLSLLHRYVAISDINKARLNAFQALNNLEFAKMLKPDILDAVIPILGPDLALQTKLNLSIQMPEDSTSVLKLHSDCNSGDTPFQLNIWIPLTDSFSTNSMFLLDEDISLFYYDCLCSSKEDFKEPNLTDYLVDVCFGSFLLFPPSLLHGNMINQTQRTRVSVNVRVKSVFSPDLTNAPSDRLIGTYYDLWHTSAFYNWSKSVYKRLT